MAFHSKTGGSSVDRFLNCPGSVSLLRGMGSGTVESDEPDYRADGTIAHEVASECLRRDLDAWEFLIPGLRRYTDEHATAVQEYINFVLGRRKELNTNFDYAEMHVEQSVTHPDEPDFYGTIDAYLLCRNEWEEYTYAEVIDYKHGVCYAVDVEDNGQLKYYAVGLQQLYPSIEEFNLVIVQPRGFHRKGPIRECGISGATLKTWADTILLPGIKVAQAGSSEFHVGGWCRFCPVKIVCPLLTSLAERAASSDPDMVGNMTNEELGRLFEQSAAIKARLNAVYTEVSRRAMSGQEGPWKIVKKKAMRQWVPGYQAPQMSVPMSPAQAELRLSNGKEITAEFARTPQNPGVTVVPLSDKRAAITRSAIDFEGLVSED